MKPELQRRVQRYGWDKAADFYDESWKEQLKPAQDKLLEMIALQPGETVFESACGTGLITFRAANAVGSGGNVVATDLSDSMIQLSSERAENQRINNITFHRMDAEQLDLEGGRFDAAISGLGLMYYPDPVQALKEMYRVLKPGGRAALAVWGERKNCGWADIFPIVDKRVNTDVCPMFFQQGTGNTLEYSLKEAGFTDIKAKRLSVHLNYPSDEVAVMGAFAGGPVALAYQRFDSKTKEEAQTEYLESIAPFRNGSKYAIPGEYVVTSAVKK